MASSIAAPLPLSLASRPVGPAGGPKKTSPAAIRRDVPSARRSTSAPSSASPSGHAIQRAGGQPGRRPPAKADRAPEPAVAHRAEPVLPPAPLPAVERRRIGRQERFRVDRTAAGRREVGDRPVQALRVAGQVDARSGDHPGDPAVRSGLALQQDAGDLGPAGGRQHQVVRPLQPRLQPGGPVHRIGQGERHHEGQLPRRLGRAAGAQDHRSVEIAFGATASRCRGAPRPPSCRRAVTTVPCPAPRRRQRLRLVVGRADTVERDAAPSGGQLGRPGAAAIGGAAAGRDRGRGPTAAPASSPAPRDQRPNNELAARAALSVIGAGKTMKNAVNSPVAPITAVMSRPIGRSKASAGSSKNISLTMRM